MFQNLVARSAAPNVLARLLAEHGGNEDIPDESAFVRILGAAVAPLSVTTASASLAHHDRPSEDRATGVRENDARPDRVSVGVHVGVPGDRAHGGIPDTGHGGSQSLFDRQLVTVVRVDLVESELVRVRAPVIGIDDRDVEGRIPRSVQRVPGKELVVVLREPLEVEDRGLACGL